MSNPTYTQLEFSLNKRSSLSNHSIRSEKVKEAAKNIALEAGKKSLQNKLESEIEKIKLNYKDEELRIQAEINETEG